MSQPRASVLAWSLAGLCMILYIVKVALYVLAHPARPSSAISTSLAGALFLIFPLVGALISLDVSATPSVGYSLRMASCG
jgi:hypothetical protein